MFRVTFPDAAVTITLADGARDRILGNCSSCGMACEHLGATFALILEEKLSLGLSAPPRARIPVESLGEEALVRQALVERWERAIGEKMRIDPADPQSLWLTTWSRMPFPEDLPRRPERP